MPVSFLHILSHCPGPSQCLSALIREMGISNLPSSSLGSDQCGLVSPPTPTLPEYYSKGSFIQQTFIDFLLCARQGAGVLDKAGVGGWEGPSQSGRGGRCVNKHHRRQID